MFQLRTNVQLLSRGASDFDVCIDFNMAGQVDPVTWQ